MKRTLLLFWVIFLASYPSFAQLPNDAVGTPIMFDAFQKESKLNELKTNYRYFKSGKKQSYWKVYSDRVGNVTFDKPGGNKTGELGFMEMVLVAQVENDWLHVYQETYDNIWPKISKQAKDMGWIRMDHLILSNYCLATENNFTHKAMVLTNIASTIDNEREMTSVKSFFHDPELKTVSQNIAKTFEIYFVFKETEKSVLLSKSDMFLGSTEEIKGSMLGWMSKANVTFWDHRICLEPNSDTVAVREYANNPIGVFSNLRQATAFLETGNSDSAIRKRYLENKRPPGLIMRSPVLNHQASLKQVGTIGYMTDIEEKELAKLQSRLQDVNDKIENINILFVIDGTKSMELFYRPVIKGISESISRLKAKYSNNRIKFGAVIYRGYSDRVPYEKIPLTTDYDKVISFLSSVQCYSNDKRNASAVFNGLINGINDAGFEEKQSNFIILVGDAGNPSPDPRGKTVQQVIDLMTKYQISTVGFQANHGSGLTYEDFNDHILEIVLGTACNLAKVKLKNCDMIKWEETDKNSYKLIYKNIEGNSEQEALVTAGRYSYSSLNSSLSVDFLEKAIEGTIDDYDTRVSKQKSMLESIMNRPSGDFTPMFETWLLNQGFTGKDIQKLRTFGAIRVEGWTSDRIQGKVNPCFIPVVFLSQTEFYNLLATCDKLNFSSTKAERRKAFQQALIDECLTIIGDRSMTAKSTIEAMSLNDVWQLLFGIDIYNQEKIGKIKIKNITSGMRFPEEDLNKFSERLRNKVNRLQMYRSKTYPYSFESNDNIYYWFLKDELP